jgi:hypothetical protein
MDCPSSRRPDGWGKHVHRLRLFCDGSHCLPACWDRPRPARGKSRRPRLASSRFWHQERDHDYEVPIANLSSEPQREPLCKQQQLDMEPFSDARLINTPSITLTPMAIVHGCPMGLALVLLFPLFALLAPLSRYTPMPMPILKFHAPPQCLACAHSPSQVQFRRQDVECQRRNSCRTHTRYSG